MQFFYLNGFRVGDPAILDAVPDDGAELIDVLIVGCGPAARRPGGPAA